MGSIWVYLVLVDIRDAALFHQAFAATSFNVRAHKPSCSPLLQLPKRNETAGEALPSAPQAFFKTFQNLKTFSGGEPPVPPFRRYAAAGAGRSRDAA